MKKLMKTLAIILAMSLAFSGMPVNSAPRNNSYTSSDFGKNRGGKNRGSNNDESVDESLEESTTLSLVEDQSTVENGELLRASTYDLRTISNAAATADSTTTVKYFPVTMYDYDTAKLNAATDKLDSDLNVREGMYFTGGSPEYTKTTTVDLSAFVEGTYYIQNIRAAENNVASWLYSVEEDTSIRGTANRNEATRWELVIEDGQYYLMSGEEYLVVGTNGDTDGLTKTKTPITISAFSDDKRGVQLSQDGYYLCQWGGADSIYYGGYNVDNDGGNGMLFYPADSDTPITPGEGTTHISSGYEEWNRWDKASGNNANGDLIYTGLVQDTLVDDQIVFNVNEGGIFDDNTNVKSIYEYVGLPFVLDANGVYTFDSDENGVYFADTDNDGDADPQSGTKDSAYNLHFSEGNPQPMPTGLSVGDGSTNAWFPYNAAGSYSTEKVNYHFGMRADLPFSMTANGRVKSTDNNSTPITFTFSGDDDVWVFIDGVLVVDLGGIHNRLDVTINFAANTVTYSEKNAQDTNNDTGSYNNPDFAMTQKLFTDSEGTGSINMTRDAFAADEDHEMSVFYLERGEGTSNCQIQFNLPMHDTVLVTKDATQSWNPGTDAVEDLTDTEQAIVDKIDFGFTLYKKTADSNEFIAVGNTNFYLNDKSGELLAINSTDASGHFYLKNGQTAKFITEIPADGVTYYVVEDKVPEGFVTPDFNYAGTATSGFDYVNEKGETVHVTEGNLISEQILDVDAIINKSYEVTAKGSVEANDTLEFICSNYLNETIPNPSIYPNEDIIVIDYGLPVQIDPLANDIFRGDTIEILYVGSEDVVVTEETNENGITSATWTEDNTIEFGNLTLEKGTKNASDNSRDTLVYKLNKQLTEVEVLTYVVQVTGNYTNETTNSTSTQTSTKTGKIYIVPATTMYYEENFNGLVSFTGDGWNKEEKKNETYVSAYQEPGVVGTVGDSTYGSDVAYLSDSQDSNGTSYYGDTTKGAIRFSYTFTGTGTSFFARTSANTGYMQVKLYKGTNTSGTPINLTYRDTYYEDTNGSTEDASGTLYNIPVYTESDLDYDTYTVVATVAKKGTAAAGGENGSGNEFYLDGIRIMQPLNESNDKVVNKETGETITDKALGAYATDGEANMEVVTLRQKLITDAELGETPWNFVVLTDTNDEITTAEEYTSIGPKEEVYLEKGQSVSFSLKYWETDGLMLYMGMKAPFGSATVQVGQTTYNLENATDCYYDITKNYSSLITKYEEADDGTMQPYYVATFTFTATDKIVSLTNIKVTGNYEFTIVDNPNFEIDGDENIDGDLDAEENGGEQ